MSTEVRLIRCSSCGYTAPANVIWAINGLCPRCLAPLATSAESSPSTGAGGGPEGREELVSGWIDAFNDRDLEGMLGRMSPRVEFHPLQLDGLDRTYRGHAGVREWFGHLIAGHHDPRLVVMEYRDAGRDRLITLGKLRLAEQSDHEPFWFLDRFSGERILSSYHYLTHPDILEHGRLFDL